ncbi:MAG: fluoride efflux transporter CrcB [Oleiphilaceae bacterium]|nr:fluoride efflux transporter CrcB [Oleiphilaceae bacterium]
MISWLAVALGGAAGGALRYWVNGLVVQRTGEVFPWGTLLVNLSGCALMGALAVLAGTQGGLDKATMALLMAGFCGSYTTVSSFSLQTLMLFQQGEASQAVANIILSLFGCMATLWLGATGVRLLLSQTGAVL